MGLFKKAGRQIERFKQKTMTAADEETDDGDDVDDSSEAPADEIDADGNEKGDALDSERETGG
jgi:hypothetical protein